MYETRSNTTVYLLTHLLAWLFATNCGERERESLGVSNCPKYIPGQLRFDGAVVRYKPRHLYGALCSSVGVLQGGPEKPNKV